MSEVCETGKSRLQLSGVLISLRRLFAFLEVKTCDRDVTPANPSVHSTEIDLYSICS